MGRCKRMGCQNAGVIDVDFWWGSVYVCEDHVEEALREASP